MPSACTPPLPRPADADLRESLKAERERLFARFEQNANVSLLLARLARAADQALMQLWQTGDMPGDCALIAVGGYGRGELFPHSDIDILLLLPHAANPALTLRLETLIGRCWDIGLDLGSSVRTVHECLDAAAQDLTVRTSLLEARLLAGDANLYRVFETQRRHHLDAADFFQSKLLEMSQRHTRYHDTPYSLEPNCKESPGGLRDLHVILWTTQAAGLGSSWSDLLANNLLTRREARELAANERLLKTLRARLHGIAGRRQDVLAFDLQTPLAEAFGYRSNAARHASEQLMRRYYWVAKAVAQLNTVVLQNIEARLFPAELGITRAINARFIERQGMLDIADPDLYQREPAAILETFLLYAQARGIKGLAAGTLRALYNARALMDAKWRSDPLNRRQFLSILQQPQGVTHALQLMNQTSVLGRYLVNFRRIVGQMQHDLLHVYTVDQHILMVVRYLRRFGTAEHAHEFPFCSQLMANFDTPWILTIAALFHDIAKGRGGDHSTLGMADARRFCRRHGLGQDEADLIAWLVEHHLTMSRVAQKQDLGDPAVIRDFAAAVGNARRLTALYLLTVADIRGTSPKVWNAWKARLLEDLYRITLRVLGGATTDPRAVLENRKEEARALLRLAAMDAHAHEALWAQLDVSAFLRHDARDIAWLTRCLHHRVHSAHPIVCARLSQAGEGLQVAVYSPDRPDLFARICGYFEHQGLNILDAKIHTTRHDYALDTFQVADPGAERATPGRYRDIIALVEHELARLIAREPRLPESARGRLSRQSRSFPIKPRVDLRPDERGEYYLLSLSAADRTGLLYAIARVLAKHQVSVHSARIDTLGERVEDLFLVSGARLAPNRALQLELESELLNVLAT